MFLMSSILLGSLLSAIPIVVHLLRKQNSVPIEWGAMQFLLETPLRARRRRSIDNWLLLLIRMGILIFLAFALARPLLPGNTFVTNTPVDVTLVIDHSLSMGRRGSPAAGGNATLFDDALKAAEKLSQMLPPSASVSIVVAEHTPRVITPVPLVMDASNKAADGAPRGEWATVLRQLHETKPGITDANIPQAVEAATEVAVRGRNLRKMILILSDEQRSNWAVGSDSAWQSAVSARDPAKLPIYAMPIAPPPSTPNLSVGSIAVQPAFLGVHRPAQITATVTNTGSADLTSIPVSLLLDGRPVANQQIPTLTPGHSNTVHFDEYFSEPGSHWLRVKADITDGLEADNTATTAVTVSPRLPVLVVDGQLTRSRIYRAATPLLFAMQPVDPSIDPSTLVTPKTISVADIDSVRLDDYPIVLLNDIPELPASTVAKLNEYVLRGHGLWIVLGPRTTLPFLNNTLAKSPLFPATAKLPTLLNKPIPIDIKDPENAAVSQITAAQRNAFAGTALRAWWPLEVRPEMHTVLATTTGDPIATELSLGNSGGKVIVWTTPADIDSNWNNLPVVPNFTPLVNETLFHLAGAQAQSQNRELDAGQTLTWNSPPLVTIPQIQSATIVTPNGAAHSVQPELRGEQYFITYKDTFAPGLYELRITLAEGKETQPIYYTVNIDKNELDPATLSLSDVEWLKNSTYLQDHLNMATLPKALSAQVGGTELWWLLATLVLLLLLIEAIMTARLAKQQTDVDPETARLVTTSSHAMVGGPR